MTAPSSIQLAQQQNTQQRFNAGTDPTAYWKQQDDLRKQRLANISPPSRTVPAAGLSADPNVNNRLAAINNVGSQQTANNSEFVQRREQAAQAKALADSQAAQKAAYDAANAKLQAQITAMQTSQNRAGGLASPEAQGVVAGASPLSAAQNKYIQGLHGHARAVELNYLNHHQASPHFLALQENYVKHGLNRDGTPIQQSQPGMVQAGQYNFQDPKDQQIAQWARQAGWPDADLPVLIGVSQAESSRRTDVTNANPNGSTDYGLMQVNDIHRGDPIMNDPRIGGASAFFDQGGWKDPVKNLIAAKAIRDSRGSWKDWVTFNNGDYQGYHPQYSVASRATQTFSATSISTQPQASSTTTGRLRANVVGTAMRYQGTPYVFAGDSLTQGVDCSGLVHEVYKMMGIATPRTAETLSHPDRYKAEGAYGGATQINGYRTNIANLRPGDLVCYQGGWRGPNLVGHVAIYAGNNQIIEAPDVGLNVRRRSLRPNETDISKGGRLIGIHLNLPGD